MIQMFFTTEFEPATVDNAVAAVCRMILANPAAVPLDTVLPVVFSKLPLKDDFDEYKTVVKLLVFLISQNGFNLNNYAELAIKILVEGAIVQSQDPDKYKIDQELMGHVVRVLNSLKEQPVFASVTGALTPESQQVLIKILQA